MSWFLAGDLIQCKGLRLLHLNWMDRMSQGCKGKAPLPFQLIPTAHLIHLNLPLPPRVSNGHMIQPKSRPHIVQLGQGWSGWWPNWIVCTDAVRPWGPYTRPMPSSNFLLRLTLTPSWITLGRTMAVLNALSLHHTSIFSLTPPKPPHDQSKSFLDLTSQDNYFRTLLKLDWTLLDIF